MGHPAEKLSPATYAPATYAPATYADLEAVPPGKVAELIHGTLYVHARPAPKHARSYSRLGYVLGPPFDEGDGGPGGWWILDEPELHLGEDVLVPDLAGWRVERLPELPETAYFPLAPDWACEILSPSTSFLDRSIKMDVYAREGVRHIWLVDPSAHLLETYALTPERRWLRLGVYHEDAKVRAEPFDAVEFDLARLWRKPKT